jgi:hypothetical protein
MKEDTPVAVQEPQNEAVGTHQEGPLENTEAAIGANGSTQNWEAEVQPDVPQIPIPYFSFSAEPTGEMGTGLGRMDGEGATRSCWNFEPTNTAGGPSSDTELTSKETSCRDCATSHTRGNTGGLTAIGSYRENSSIPTMT